MADIAPASPPGQPSAPIARAGADETADPLFGALLQALLGPATAPAAIPTTPAATPTAPAASKPGCGPSPRLGRLGAVDGQAAGRPQNEAR